MPLYQYGTPPLQGVDTLANMLERSAAIRAQQAVSVAGINAGLVQNLGQTVAQPLMSAATRMADPEYQLRKTQAEAATRDLASQKLVEQAILTPENRSPVTDADGNVTGTQPDDTKIAAWLQKNGGALGGHAALAWTSLSTANAENRAKLQQTLAQIQASQVDAQTKQQSLFAAQQAYVSEQAWHTLQQLKTLSDPDARKLAGTTFAVGLAQAASNGGLDPNRAKAIGRQVAGASPEQLQSVIESLINPADAAKLEAQAATTKKSTAEAEAATATAAESRAKAAAIEKWGYTGQPPTAQAKSYRVMMPNGKTQDVPLEFVPGKTPGEPGQYFLNQPDGTRREMFPGKDFVDVPPASIQMYGMGQAAEQGLPAWATDASRPSGPGANTVEPKIGRTPNGLYQDAITYIQTGQYPPSGRGNDPAARALRTAVDSKVGAIAADAGVDVPTLRAQYKANAASLSKTQQFADAAQSFMSTADKNMGLLEKALEKAPDLGAPFLNRPWREFQSQVLGNTDQKAFQVYLTSVRNEYGKLINNPNLSGQFTDSARGEAHDMLADDATVGQVLASARALSAEGGNRLQSLGEQLKTITGRTQIGGPGGGAGGDKTAAAGGAPKEGDVKPIPGYPGTEQTFKNGKWIRTK